MKRTTLTLGLALVVSGCMDGATGTGTVSIPPGTETLRLAVGETDHLDAFRGRSCSDPAPSWQQVQRWLPESSIVTYSDGGESTRDSISCGQVVPTRAVNATGVRPGTEINQYTDRIAIIVE